MNQSSLDRNLLFGILALQVDLIDRDRLVAATAKWASERARPLGEILVEQGALTAVLCDALDPMVDAHVERHGGDPARSLAALTSTDQVRGALQRVAGASPELHASITRLSEETAGVVVNDQATIDFGADSATVDRSAGEPRGRFRVLRPHARGGLGQVYIARDNELGRKVALKEILADKAANPELRARFVLEAEINGNLEHPGIVPVYGLGTYSDGRPFYAMRFIEGDSLKQAIERFHSAQQTGDATSKQSFDSFEFRQLLRRFVDVCNAIAYAHSRGVLHRDLKPANVMLGHYGETLIIDWGLAKATGHSDPGLGEPSGTPVLPASGSSIEQTEAGSALGTPAYMSPEQAWGRIDELGPATDLYSLGATLFAVLTGRPPVEGGNVVEILSRVRSGDVDSPRSIVPEVPRPLEAVCRKAMALRPEDRYPRANALADDVERWLADEPVSAEREPWIDGLRRWGRRNRTLVATGATALSVAVAGLGIVAAVQTQARQQLSIKNGQLNSANEARGRALDKANSRVELALQALGQFRLAVDANLDVQNRPENVPLRNELLQTPVAFFRTLGDDLREDPAARPEDRLKLADAQLELAQLTRDIGNQAAALDAAGEAVATLEALAADRAYAAESRTAQRKLLEVLGLQATLQTDNGKRDEARKTLDRGVELGASLVSTDADVETRLALARLFAQSASADADASRTDASLATLKRARSLLDGFRAGTEQSPSIVRLQAELLAQTAGLQARAGNPKEAIETLKSAIQRLQPLTEGPKPDWESRGLLSDVRMQIGKYREPLGQSSEALEDEKRALQTRRAMVKERPANLANRLQTIACLDQLSKSLADLGQDQAALEHLREARDLLESARLENPRNVRVISRLVGVIGATGYSLYNLGRTVETLASFEQTIPLLEELVRIEPQVAYNRYKLAGGHYNIALLRKSVGKLETSLEADLAALAIRRQMAAEFPAEPEYRFQVAASLGNIGISYNSWKHDMAAAIAYEREAVSLLVELASRYPDVAKYSEYLARTRSNMAVPLFRLGRIEEALAVSQAAEPYLASRVRAEPEFVQARIDLALNLAGQGDFLLATRRPEEAERIGRRALETLSAIPQAGHGAIEVVVALVSTFNSLGNTAASRGRFEEAVERYSRAVSTAQPDPAVLPADERLRNSLRNAFEGRTEANAHLGRLEAAQADWLRLASIPGAGEPASAALGPILIRGWSGDPGGFLADAEAAVAAGTVKKGSLVTLARAACAAIPKVKSDIVLSDRLAASAVAWLVAARIDGVFASPGEWRVVFDPRFDPIAQRRDFRDLKADLTFPVNPFASTATAP